MVEVKQEQAQKFIDNISKKDKVAIITDHDPDGFTSGILFYDYCEKKGAMANQFTFTRGISKIEDFQLRSFNKIITTDLSAKTVLEIIEKYKDKNILFMDHHPSDAKLPESVLEYRTMYRGYIPSARSAYELTGGKIWIAMTGIIADVGELYKENDEFIKEAVNEIGMTLNELKEKVAYEISNCILYLNEEPKKAFKLIKELSSIEEVKELEIYSRPIKEEVKFFLKDYEKKSENLGNAKFYYFEPKLAIKPIVTAKICLKKENYEKVFLFASPKGIKKIGISARNQSGKLNMAEILKAGIKNLKDAQAGGHFKASGATINKEDLEKFKENIREFLKKNPIS